MLQHALRTQTGNSIVATSAIRSNLDFSGCAAGGTAAAATAAAEQAAARRFCRCCLCLHGVGSES